MKKILQNIKWGNLILLGTILSFLALLILMPIGTWAAEDTTVQTDTSTPDITPLPIRPNLAQYAQVFGALNAGAPYEISEESQLDKFAVYPKANKIIVRMSLKYTQEEYQEVLKARGAIYDLVVSRYSRAAEREICRYGVSKKLLKEGIKIFAQMKFKKGPNLFYVEVKLDRCVKLCA